jgi:hypothetical protein
MPVTTDIVRTWRSPRAVQRDQLALGPREDRALIYLMLACGVLCVAQLPRLAREAHLLAEPLDQLIGSAVYGWVFVMPLAFYLLAILFWLALKALGRETAGVRLRIALFWALLASTPLALFHGLLAGMNGATLATNLVGAAWVLSFAVFAAAGLAEAARR